MSNLMPSFTEKVKQRTAEHHAIIEQTTRESLQLLERNLQGQFDAVQRLIEENMAGLQHAIRDYRIRPWIYPLIATLLVVPATLTGWAILDHLITKQVQTLERHHRTLKALGPAGIEHAVKDGTLYLVLPKNAKKPDVFKATTGRWVVTLEE